VVQGIHRLDDSLMQTENSFDKDPFPGKPKILFVGLAESSHTHSWINLLAGVEFNIRLFALPTGGYPPDYWKIRTYLPSKYLPEGLDQKNRRCLYPTPEKYREAEKLWESANIIKKFYHISLEGFTVIPFQHGFKKIFFSFCSLFLIFPIVCILSFRTFIKRAFGLTNSGRSKNIVRIKKRPSLTGKYNLDRVFNHVSFKKKMDDCIKPLTSSPEGWLSNIIQEWQPDIIHTLGLYDNQGGHYYYLVRKKFSLEKYGKWILQLRGGSDLTLRRHDPDLKKQIYEMLMECDQIISDNKINMNYAEEMGIPVEKFSELTPVPGTGGIDTDSLRSTWSKPPSLRERIILWPKVYDCQWSLTLPVFEAIRMVWDKIKPCKIYMLAATPETRSWYHTLPEEIKQNCLIYERIPRDKVLSLMAKARILLAPSLVDGIPNSLYEAMACGAFPIVSPIATIASLVKNEENVLFARNLYPHELADALVKAMMDDELVDLAASRNLNLVRIFAEREDIAKKLSKYYTKIIGQSIKS